MHYGITHEELKSWNSCQYLLKIPMRQFQNNVNNGFSHNLKEVIYSGFGIKATEQEMIIKPSDIDNVEGELNAEIDTFKKLNQEKKYIVNWNLAYFYMLPQMPNHPMRDFLIDTMKREEPRMIETYRLGMKFKQEIIAENKGVALTEQEVSQKVMMRMQAHMMKKNGPNGFNPHLNPEKEPSK